MRHSRRVMAPSSLPLLAVWALAFALPAVNPALVRGQARELLKIDDLYRYDAVADPVLLPEGRGCVYVRQWATAGEPEHRFALWHVPGVGEPPRPFEAQAPDARQPILSPDGRWLAVLSTRPLPTGTPAIPTVPRWSDAATDIWLVPTTGGPAIPLAGADKPYGRVLSDPFYANVAFSADGKRLVFVADDGRPERTREELEREVTVVREDQGEGYEGFGPAQIWVAELDEAPAARAARVIRRLTNDEHWYGDPQWFPDGGSVLVHANRTDDTESVRFSINKDFDLWRIQVDSGELERITSGPGADVSPRISADGRRALCLSSPRKGPHADIYNLTLIEFSEGGVRSRVLVDLHGPTPSASLGGVPTFPLPDECWWDDHHALVSTVDGLRSTRVAVDVERPEERAVAEADAQPASRRERSELLRALLPASQVYWNSRFIAEDRVVRWKSFDGQEIEGVLTLPPPESGAAAPYKLLLHPHGGPHSRSGSGQGFTVQLFAAHGYAVFQPNFRGTYGYSRDFLDADRHDLGGGDMRDILLGIDSLVEQQLVDPRRQFVYGVSYGGYMTSWLIGHTHQFRAAAPQNAVTDLEMMWSLSDLQSWTDWEFGGRPWEVPQQLRERSPLTFASAVRTPTLILHADRDRRCPLAMGQAFHRVLREVGTPTEMVIYHGARHGITRLPQQADIYERVLAWFAEHDAPPQ